MMVMVVSSAFYQIYTKKTVCAYICKIYDLDACAARIFFLRWVLHILNNLNIMAFY